MTQTINLTEPASAELLGLTAKSYALAPLVSWLEAQLEEARNASSATDNEFTECRCDGMYLAYATTMVRVVEMMGGA